VCVCVDVAAGNASELLQPLATEICEDRADGGALVEESGQLVFAQDAGRGKISARVESVLRACGKAEE